MKPTPPPAQPATHTPTEPHAGLASVRDFMQAACQDTVHDDNWQHYDAILGVEIEAHKAMLEALREAQAALHTIAGDPADTNKVARLAHAANLAAGKAIAQAEGRA